MDWKTINIAPEIVAKYLAKGKTPPSKPKQEWVTRYHRTKTSNAPSIEQHGLLTHNPNIGDNTWLPGKADYHKIWLADNPSEIPVLRQLMSEAPQDVTTYKVRMPKGWYMESPRFYMPKGRADAAMKRAPADKIRLTNEGKYKIDLLGRDIPPEYLQKLPTYKTDTPIAQERAYLVDNAPHVTVFDDTPQGLAARDKLPRRLKSEVGQLKRSVAKLGEDHDYDDLLAVLVPSDELIDYSLPPLKVVRGIIDQAKRDDAEYLAREGYPDINEALDSWTKMGIENKRVQGDYSEDWITNGLSAIPGLKADVDRYLRNYADKADWGNTEVSDWLTLTPKELAQFWIDSELPAIKNKNLLTDQDILPVFSQVKHKLMVPDDRYKGWEYGSYGAYPPTDDIDFKAAATLLEALQRSDRKDLLPQARDILFNNLQYYK